MCFGRGLLADSSIGSLPKFLERGGFGVTSNFSLPSARCPRALTDRKKKGSRLCPETLQEMVANLDDIQLFES
jgi:hypothetical protein